MGKIEMRQLSILACLTFVISSCGPPTSEGEDTKFDQSKSAPEFKAIAGNDIFAVTIPEGISAEELVATARANCGDREFCQVYGWQNESDAARAFPMTDRETANLAFRYAHNRSTGYESRTWDCNTWPREDSAECI